MRIWVERKLQHLGRITLIGIQLTGLVMSIMLVGITFSNSDQVEERLRRFAIVEVERAAEKVWSSTAIDLGDDSRTEKLMALSDRLGLDAELLATQRQEVVPSILAFAKSKTCQRNCQF